MALPENRDEWNRIDEQARGKRFDAQAANRPGGSRIEEHQAIRDRQCQETGERAERHPQGHDFAMDLHPERYPRESLSRLEEGILEDDELRYSLGHRGSAACDVESLVDDARNLSRTLIVLGGFLLIFAWVLLLWVGWDVRSGEIFFSTMCVISIAVGLGLAAWGFVERQRIMRLRARLGSPIGDRIEEVGADRELRDGDRAA